MATISVPSSIPGKTYSVKIAGDAPTPEEQARIAAFVSQSDARLQSYLPGGVAQAPEPEEPSMLGEIGSGLGRGFFGSLAAAPGGIGALAEAGYGKLTGQPITPGSTAFGGVLQDISEEGRQAVEETFGPAAETTSGKIGEAVGSIGSFLIPGGVVGGGARLLGAGARAAGMLGTAAGTGFGAALGADQQAQDIGDAILNGDVVDPDAQQSAILWGGLIGSSEMIAGGAASKLIGTTYKILNKIPPAMKEGAIATIGGRVLSALKTGGVEGAQEALSQVAQNLVSREYYDEERKLLEGAGESFGIGGAAGAALDLALTSARAPAVKRSIQQRQAAEEAEVQRQIEEDQTEDSTDILERIGFGEKSLQPQEPAPQATAPTPTVPAPKAPERLALPAPQAAPPAPEVKKPEPRSAVPFRWRDYTTAAQNVVKAGDASIPSIQRAAKIDPKKPVPPAVAKQMRNQMVTDGILVADRKAKGGYRVQTAQAPQFSQQESYQRTLDDVQRDFEDAQAAQQKALLDARRAEQTGPKTEARKFLLAADDAAAAAERAKQTRAEIEARMPRVAVETAVPSIERPAATATPTARVEDITTLPTEIQDSAVEKRKAQLGQALEYYNQSAAQKREELKRLQQVAKKGRISFVERQRIDDLKKSVEQDNYYIGEIKSRMARPSEELIQSRAKAQAEAIRRTTAEAERSARAPTYTAKEGELFTALRKRLDNLGLDDVKLVAERMIRPANLPEGSLIEGTMDVDPRNGNRVIAVAMGVYNPNMSQQELFDAVSSVMNHEVIHAIRSLGLFKDAEWKVLSDLAARQRYMKMKGGKVVERNYTYLQRAKQMYSNDTQEVQIEEAVAEMFRDYVAGRLKIGGRPRTLMERIKDFFRSIWKSHEDVGITDPNEIFEGVRFGQIGKRARPADQKMDDVGKQSRLAAARAPSDPDFQRWASGPNGERVLTDANGNPKVYYTGTSKDQDFTKFKVSGHGGWFTTDPNEASNYAEENDSMGFRRDGWEMKRVNTASRVIPVFLRARNPFTGPKPASVSMRDNYKKAQTEWFDSLRRQGYDAWVPDNAPSLAVMLGDPSQVKSVFARGFDSKGDMRRYSVLRVNGQYDKGRMDDLETASKDRAITKMQSDGDTPDRISTRQPYTKRATENPITENLIIDLKAMKASPAAFEHNMRVIKGYPGFVTDSDDPDVIAEDFIRFVSENLTWLYERVPAEIRNQSKRWYDGARRITENWSGQYEVPDYTVAGVLAALSPQKDWYQNVSLAERVLDIHTQFTRGNNIAFMPTEDMAKTAARIYGKPAYADSLTRVLTTPYADLANEAEQAMWLRIYDETYNPRGYRTVSAEGEFVGEANGNVAWGSNVEIGKAIYVLKNQDRESTSLAMGAQHKVRNFFNNILAPNAPHGDVTIDTHAVAAALLRPLSGSSMEVHHNFGSTPENKKKPANWVPSKSIGDSGASGMYGIYAEAYRRAARDLGVLPRELQSITWEAVRGLFPAVDKRNKAKAQSVNDQWAAVSAGKITPMEARENISKIMGGINDPTWYGLDYTAVGATAPTSYEGELAVSRLDRGYDRSVGGVAGRDAGGDRGIGGGAAAPGRDVFGRSERAAQRRGAAGQTRYSVVGGVGPAGGRGREEGRGLAPLEGAPRVQGATGPDIRLVQVAEQYARDNGIDLRRQGKYVEVDEDRARRIADEFDKMEHAPNDPKVRAAYEELIRQTRAQYDALENAGYKFWFIDPDDPGEYGSSPWNAMRDLRATQSMGVFPTIGGFGTRDVDTSGNPLLQETGLMWPYGSPDGTPVPVLANDLFRAVHDAFGHGIEGSGFRSNGEENAWQAHIRLFTGEAKGALTTETRGQNSWLNYGPYGESNRNAKVEDTVFADQKVGLMPEWTWTEGLAPDAEPYGTDTRMSMLSVRPAMSPATQKKVQTNQKLLMYARSADFIAKTLNLGGYGLGKDKAREFTDGLLRRFQDSMLPIGRMVQELSKRGLTITDAMDPYLQEELMHGVVGKRIAENQDGLFQPVVDAVKKLNVPKAKIDQLVSISNSFAKDGKGYVGLALEKSDSPRMVLADAYLYAKHARERNRYIQQNKDQTNATGSGMSDAEANAILQWFESLDANNKQAIGDIAKGIRLVIADTNKTRVEAGLIGADVQDPYKFYVPLRGITDEDTNTEEDNVAGIPGTPRYGAKGREDPKALGRYGYAADIIANVFTQNQNAILRGERNKVGQSLLQLLRADPAMTKDFAEILPKVPMTRAESGRKDAKLKMVPDRRVYEDPYILVVKEDGKEKFVRFTDPRTAGAMNGKNGMSATNGRFVINAMQKVNRYLSSINTSYNPEFMITNMVRDLQTAGVNINQFEMDGLTSTAVSNVPAALKGIKRSIRDKDDSSEWSKIYKDFVDAGGQNATNQFNSLAEEMENIQTMLGDISESGLRGKWAKVKNGFVGRGAGSMLQFLEDYNTVVENGIRVATYKALLDRGFTRQRAAQAARNVTVNFAKGGDYRQFMNAMYLFYNASLQGSFALLNAATRSSKVRKLWGSIIVAGFVMDQVAAAMSDEDDDGEKVYDKIPLDVLETNMIIMDPFGITPRGQFSIPLPYGLHMAYNAGRALSRAYRGEYTAGETTQTIWNNVVDTINPIGGSESFVNFAVPTVLDPFVDVIENRDFADKPIYKEALPFDRTPEPRSQMFWSTTSPSAVWVAQNLNSLTGGNEVRPGLIDWSPDLIQFWTEFVTGGIGRFSMGIFEAPAVAYNEGFSEELFGQIPLARKLYRSVSERDDMSSYIDGAKAILMAGEELKRARETGDEQWVRDTMQRYPKELRLVGPFKSIESGLREVSKMRNKIKENPALADSQKRLLLEKLDERKKMLLTRANALLREADL